MRQHLVARVAPEKTALTVLPLISHLRITVRGDTMMYNELPELEYLLSIFEYNKVTGKLLWKKKVANRVKVGSEAGWKASKYLQVTINNTHYYVHRIIWKMVKGSISNEMQIEHDNGIHTDNRWFNLRLADQSTNMKNQTIPTNNSSGIIGVSFHKSSGLWLAKIGNKGSSETTYHNTREQAVIWRKQKEHEYGFHVNHGRAKRSNKRGIL